MTASYVENDSENDQFEFHGSTAAYSTQFLITSPARHATFCFNTMAGVRHFLRTLNDGFGQKLAIWAIWDQIQSSMYLRWNYISFYQP